MSHADLRSTILARLTSVMQTMPPPVAKALASVLTARISEALAGRGLSPALELPAACLAQHAEIRAVLPDHSMTLSTLDVPWTAYARARRAQTEARPQDAAHYAFLASLPAPLESAMRGVFSASKIWPGSLLDHLTSLIADARDEVLIIGPYWSQSGVEAMLRRLAPRSKDGCHVDVLTMPRGLQKPDAVDALLRFRQGLMQAGGRCTIHAPPVAAGWTPLVHAKAVVADRSRAYLGSANFTGNGWDASVELGVALEGAQVAQLWLWLSALQEQMQPWERQ